MFRHFPALHLQLKDRLFGLIWNQRMRYGYNHFHFYLILKLIPFDVPFRNGETFRNFFPFPRIVSSGCHAAESDRFDLCCVDAPPTGIWHQVNCQLEFENYFATYSENLVKWIFTFFQYNPKRKRMLWRCTGGPSW